MRPEKDLLTRAEAAQYLGVGIRTIDGYIKRGLLTAFQPAGTNLTRIHYKELEAFLSKGPKARVRGPILSL